MKARLLLLVVPVLVSCSSYGPGTIPRDRFDYGETISKSWHEQMLLNIVKLRYLEMPMFVDVSSVINQYAVTGSLGATATWRDANLWSANGAARFEDRPTITYSPIQGKDFTRSLMTPIPPGAVLFLIQSGWPVDMLYRICVQAVNGIYNGSWSSMGRQEPDPRFDVIVNDLLAIQQSGSIGLAIEGIDRGETAVMVIRRAPDPEAMAMQREVRSLLGLDEDAERFRVSYGSDAEDGAHMAMLTRSLFEILLGLSHQIEVSQKDIDEQRTTATAIQPEDTSRLINIHTGSKNPENAFVSVRYRDQWFWIDDRDMLSKRTFGFMMILFNLTDTGSSSAVPLLTVGAS